MAGILYVVATPIGNLDDLSLRAAKVLRTVAAVACEDTRQTAKLMEAAGAQRPLISLHEHNEKERSGELVSRLLAGEDLALVSDAGTPLISDPGYRLVEAAIVAGIRIVPIPGASAVLAALSASGLATDAFVFAGFLPQKQKARREALEKWCVLPVTVIFFESPHRVLETLTDIGELFPERRLVAARELTKIHEEFLRGTAKEIYSLLKTRSSVRGEFTLLLERPAETSGEQNADPGRIRAEFAVLLAAGYERMEAMKALAKQSGLSKRAVYVLLERKGAV